jgi:hypothetical protein
MRLECNIGDGDIPAPMLQLKDILRSPTQAYDAHGKEIFPPQSICDELVNIYFDYMHDKQHALFHRPSFIANQREGCAPTVLVAAIMALSARFF